MWLKGAFSPGHFSPEKFIEKQEILLKRREAEQNEAIKPDEFWEAYGKVPGTFLQQAQKIAKMAAPTSGEGEISGHAKECHQRDTGLTYPCKTCGLLTERYGLDEL